MRVFVGLSGSDLLQCGACCINSSHRHFEATVTCFYNAPIISKKQLPCQNLNVHHAINILAYTWVSSVISGSQSMVI